MDATIWRIVGYISVLGFVGCLIAFMRSISRHPVKSFIYSMISAFITLGISEAVVMNIIYYQISPKEMHKLNELMHTRTAELVFFTIGTMVFASVCSLLVSIFIFKNKAGFLPFFSTSALLFLHTFSIAYIVIY